MNKIEILSELEMKSKYQKSIPLSPYTEVQDFVEYLKTKHLSLNPKLQPSIFQLKNGLPFIGMATKDLIQGGEVLIRVPENLILSSAKAASEPLLIDVFKDPFFTAEHQSWEDRVIIIYCMFLLYQKDKNNPWYQMVKRFPQECDVVFFWSSEELDSFKDKTLKKSAELDRISFEEEWKQFQQLQKKHEILNNLEFNKNNYKIMFMTLMNRAFGASLNFVSLAPLAELFNHHSNTVFYNTQKTSEIYFKDEKEELNEVQSTGSCESDEYLEDDEFSYDKLDMIPFNWECDQSYNLNKKEKIIIVKEVSQILKLIDDQLNWDSFTIKVVGPFIFKTKVTQKEYLVGRKQYAKTKQELQVIRNSIETYKDLFEKYYFRFHKKSLIKKIQKIQLPKSEGGFKYPLVTKDYQSLIIKTGKHDKFEENSQVFFNYGKNSNRTLLLHYGFALEGNKYEHCWVTFRLHKYLKDYPDVIEKIMEKNLSLMRKFKIYHHKLNVDLIIFFRLNSWMFYGQTSIEEIFQVKSISKEVRILQKIIEVLEEQAKVYQSNYDLTNSSLNYHQYFIQVYHLEKLNILQKQIHLLNLLIDILRKVEKGMSLGEAISQLTVSEINILNLYLSTVKI